MKSKPTVIGTALLALMASKAVFACSENTGGAVENESSMLPTIYFLLCLLSLSIVPVLYFRGSRKGLWVVVLTILAVVILAPVTFFLGIMMCGDFASPLLFDLVIFASLAGLQIGVSVLDISDDQPSILG